MPNIYHRDVVRNPAGDIITMTNYLAAHDTKEAVEKFSGYLLEVKTIKEGDKDIAYFVQHSGYVQKPPTLPQRAVIEAFAHQCAEYTVGVKRNAHFTFPKIVHYERDNQADSDPLTFIDEKRAYQFAEIAESLFYVDAQVIETPQGWAVTVTNGDSSIDSETLAELRGACRVVCQYQIGDDDPADVNLRNNEREYSPKVREAWHERRSYERGRTFIRMEAIQDSINDIQRTLERLAPAKTAPAKESSDQHRRKAARKVTASA